MRWFPILLLSLAACDSPSPAFYNATKMVREVEGSRFTLRFNGPMVEAIRTSPEMLPTFQTIAARATKAVTAERPECEVAWVEGDPAMMWLGLSCNGEKPPERIKRFKTTFCDLDLEYMRGDYYEGVMTCTG